MFADTVSSLGCEQLISRPTRINPSKQSILDHIYVNNSMVNSIVSPAVITHSLSDHFPTIVHLKLKTKRTDENRPLIRIFKLHLIKNFVEDINSKLQSLEAPNFEKLTNVLTDIGNKHFPKTKLSRKQFNSAKKLWITQKILKSIKKQNKLFVKYQKTRSDAHIKTYKSFRNKLTHQKETAKAMFFQREIGKSKNISSTWKTINKIPRKGKHNSTSLASKLNVNGIPLTNPSSICFKLNKYFCNIGHVMAKSIDKSSIKANLQSYYEKGVIHSIYFEHTNDATKHLGMMIYLQNLLRKIHTCYLLFYLVFLIHVSRVVIIRMDLK